MKPIRILIVDDHTLFRSGIKLVLQRHEGFEVVGEAATGWKASSAQSSSNPTWCCSTCTCPAPVDWKRCACWRRMSGNASCHAHRFGRCRRLAGDVARRGTRLLVEKYRYRIPAGEYQAGSARRIRDVAQIAHKLAIPCVPRRRKASSSAEVSPGKLSPRERKSSSCSPMAPATRKLPAYSTCLNPPSRFMCRVSSASLISPNAYRPPYMRWHTALFNPFHHICSFTAIGSYRAFQNTWQRCRKQKLLPLSIPPRRRGKLRAISVGFMPRAACLRDAVQGAGCAV